MLYVVSPGCVSLVDAGGEIIVFGSLERKKLPFQTSF